MPTGRCECCGKYTRDLAACPKCGEMIGLCCWSFDQQCCLHCKAEAEAEE